MMVSIFKGLLGKKKEKTKEPEKRPESGTIIFKGKIKNRSKLKTELQSLSIFSDVTTEKDAIRGMIVESTDRNKNPYLYIRCTFQDDLEVFYSITPEVPNPSIRKLNVLKTMFTLVSLLETKGAFEPQRDDLYSRVVESFDLCSGFADTDSLKMKYDLDRFSKENAQLKEELSKTKTEKEGLNHELLELEKRCERMNARISSLERVTDAELDSEIVKWVEDHEGTLDENRFCDSFSIKGARLEERLDHLAKSGVIRIV